MNTLDTKVAIVTGSSRGIGRTIALRLAAEGAKVVVNHRGSTREAAAVTAEIEANGGTAHTIQADISTVAGTTQLVEDTLEAFEHLDIVVNNAGISIRTPIAHATENDFDATFAANVKGPLFMIQQAAQHMADHGRVINISSGATLMNPPTSAMYSASKGALNQLTMVAAKEFGGRNITVNAVSPGFTETGLLDDAVRQKGPTMTPLGRLGTPDDIANVVAFLAGPQGSWMTGQIVQAGGGVV